MVTCNGIEKAPINADPFTSMCADVMKARMLKHPLKDVERVQNHYNDMLTTYAQGRGSTSLSTSSDAQSHDAKSSKVAIDSVSTLEAKSGN